MEKKWVELTRDEKREERFKRWLAIPEAGFSSPEVKQAYKERITRLSTAIRGKEPDRVPVILPVGNFPAYYAGRTLQAVMYDYNKLRLAWSKFIHDFDMDTYAGPAGVHSGKVLEILNYKLYKWPGHELVADVAEHQWVEGEYMGADEYDDLIKDPSDYIFRVRIPRVIGALEPLKKLVPFTSILTRPLGLLAPFTLPDVQTAFLALVEAGKEIAKLQEVVSACSQEALAAGFPSLRGGAAEAPFDILGDTLRGTQGIIMDMYRQPDKLFRSYGKGNGPYDRLGGIYSQRLWGHYGEFPITQRCRWLYVYQTI